MHRGGELLTMQKKKSSTIGGEKMSGLQIDPKTERLFFIDNLRIALTILVVLHHQAVLYATNAVLLLFLMLNQAFFMGLFFFLSGLFTPTSYERKGLRVFLKDRLMRLGIPIVIYIAVVSPIAQICMSFYRSTEIGIQLLTSLTLGRYFNMIGIGPLWFLVMLLIFDVCYLLWRAATSNKPGKTGQFAAPKVRTICLFIVALAFATYLMRMITPINTWVLFFPSLSYLPQYVSFFILGTIAHQRDWLRGFPAKSGRTGFILAIASTLILLPVAMSRLLGPVSDFIGLGTWRSGIYALWDSTFAVGLCLGLITFFRRRFDHLKNFGKSLQQSCFTVFIIHSVIIVVAAAILRDLQIMPLLKFVIAGCISVPLSFAVAWLIRKIPRANRIL